MLTALKSWARRITTDLAALYLAARDGRTPLAAKLVAGVTLAYALSPVDLIPDFIPVLGYLDDLILVPLGILLAVRLVPPDLMAELRATAAEMDPLPTHRGGAVLVVGLWLVAGLLVIWWLI